MADAGSGRPQGAGGDGRGRATFAATASTTYVIVPLFFVAGLAVQIGSDLHLGPGALGVAVSTYFAATAASTATLGRVVQRVGARRSLVATVVVSGFVLVGIGLAQSVWQIALFLAIGGVANGAVHPASNALLAGNGGQRGLGLALGIKQAAPTAAIMLAGLAVPLVALTIGWRWSFAVGAVAGLALLLALAATREPPRTRLAVETLDGSASMGIESSLLRITVAAGLGGAAGNSITVFLVDAGVRMAGLAEGHAGLVYAAASGAGLLGRIGFGWAVDRPRGPGPLLLSVWLLASGVVGYLLMSTGEPALFVVGGICALGLGWAWPGLVHVAVVRRRPDVVARATGTVMTGFATGGFTGPLIFGQVVQRTSYEVLWLGSAALCVISGVLLWGASRQR